MQFTFYSESDIIYCGDISVTCAIMLRMKENMSKLREVPVTIRMQPKIVQSLTASNLAC